MKGPKPPKGMGKILKQAQKMQADMMKAQEEIALLEVEGSAGGGAVTVRLNGQMEVISISIDPEAVDPEDVETLEDLVMVAINQALKEFRAKSDERLASVTGGLGGMGMPGMPF